MFFQLYVESIKYVRMMMLIASDKIPEREGSISPSGFYGQLPDY